MPRKAFPITGHDISQAIAKQEFHVLPDGFTTVCVLTMDNGFVVRGMATCDVSSQENADVGRDQALARARGKVGMFLAFRRAETEHGEGGAA